MLIGLFRRPRRYPPNSACCGERISVPRALRSVRTSGHPVTSDRAPELVTSPRPTRPDAADSGLDASASRDRAATVIGPRANPAHASLTDFIALARRMSIPTDVAIRHFVARNSSGRDGRGPSAPGTDVLASVVISRLAADTERTVSHSRY